MPTIILSVQPAHLLHFVLSRSVVFNILLLWPAVGAWTNKQEKDLTSACDWHDGGGNSASLVLISLLIQAGVSGRSHVGHYGKEGR